MLFFATKYLCLKPWVSQHPHQQHTLPFRSIQDAGRATGWWSSNQIADQHLSETSSAASCMRKNGCETNRWLLGGSYHSHSVSSWQLWLASPRFLGLFTSQMAFLWLMNGGDPNHLRYLGRPFKYFGTYPVGWWAPGKSSQQQKIKESKGEWCQLTKEVMIQFTKF